MVALNSLSLLLGSSWASGINLYMTVAALGFSHRMDWFQLPGELDVLAHPGVIIVASVLYLIEFVADKIPYVDSIWDSVHTLIRPLGAAILGGLSVNEMGAASQVITALLTGSVALDSHLTKATARAAINTSPEPLTNTLASVTEDVSVLGILFLIMAHPLIAGALVILFILVSFWFLRKMFRFVKGIFRPHGARQSAQVAGNE